MSDKTDIWMPLYIGDYLSATTHLGAVESGAYLHLLMHQWKNGKLPAESESLRRIARVEAGAWSSAWAILASFFDHASGYPVQLRLEAIRAEWDGKKAKAVKKAKAAAELRWVKPQEDARSKAAETTPGDALGDASSNASGNARSNAQAMPAPCPSSSSSPSSSSLPSSLKTTTGGGTVLTSREKATFVAKRLQAETSLKDWKLQVTLTAVALGEVEEGLSETAVFDAMAVAWQEFADARPKLDKPWGALTFFGHGYWKNKMGWPWKPGMAPERKKRYLA